MEGKRQTDREKERLRWKEMEREMNIDFSRIEQRALSCNYHCSLNFVQLH